MGVAKACNDFALLRRSQDLTKVLVCSRQDVLLVTDGELPRPYHPVYVLLPDYERKHATLKDELPLERTFPNSLTQQKYKINLTYLYMSKRNFTEKSSCVYV